MVTMGTIRIKFRPSSIMGKEGKIYYKISYGGQWKAIRTHYKLYPTEWDKRQEKIIFPHANTKRAVYLHEIARKIEEDLWRIESAIASLLEKHKPYTANDIVTRYKHLSIRPYFGAFMQEVIIELEQAGKLRTAEAYRSAYNSFLRFTGQKDVLLEDINQRMATAYETWLKREDMRMNSVSFYMRILRAVYNRAVEKGITIQRSPFRQVYTGIGKTAKRAVHLETIRQLKALELRADSSKAFARDLFLFSFYTRGMAFVDMAYLKKTDICNGHLAYRRQKTGQKITVRWEPCMQEIAECYGEPTSPYLLPIIRNVGQDERKQYITARHRANRILKQLGEKLGLDIPLTLYCARHTWASIAKSKNMPLSLISEGLGHESEATTRIYLASLETSSLDEANSLVIGTL